MLIAMMVGRNEVNRYLTQVLDRLSSQVDHICFVDDCSDDNTLEVAKSYSATWAKMDEPTFTTNEFKLRSTAWDLVKTKASEGDWVLAIDCDEELYGLDQGRALMNKWKVIGITFYHMWNEHQYRIDGAWKPVVSSRLFAYQKDGVFQERNLACGAEPTYVQDLIRTGKFCIDSPMRMKHLGYQRKEDQRDKHDRYMRIDGGKYHSLKHLKSIIETPKLADWNE